MIEAIKNIKKYFNNLERILTAKISGKKYFTRFFEGIFTAKIANIKNRTIVLLLTYIFY